MKTRQRWPNQVGLRCEGLSSCGWRPGNMQDKTLLAGVARSFFNPRNWHLRLAKSLPCQTQQRQCFHYCHSFLNCRLSLPFSAAPSCILCSIVYHSVMSGHKASGPGVVGPDRSIPSSSSSVTLEVHTPAGKRRHFQHVRGSSLWYALCTSSGRRPDQTPEQTQLASKPIAPSAWPHF